MVSVGNNVHFLKVLIVRWWPVGVIKKVFKGSEIKIRFGPYFDAVPARAWCLSPSTFYSTSLVSVTKYILQYKPGVCHQVHFTVQAWCLSPSTFYSTSLVSVTKYILQYKPGVCHQVHFTVQAWCLSPSTFYSTKCGSLCGHALM